MAVNVPAVWAKPPPTDIIPVGAVNVPEVWVNVLLTVKVV